MKKLLIISSLVFGLSFSSNAQVLISLLLGDKLNSEKLEFGLVGGMAMTHTSTVENSSTMGTFNLGFYFDIRMDDKWSFTPGVLVVSKMGAKSIELYNIPGQPGLDQAMAGGDVRRKLEYFQIPLLMKYKIVPRFHVALGPQISLLHTATDIFTNDINSKDDLVYNHDIEGQYKKLDAGIVGGVGFALKDEIKSMNIGVKYYQGMVDVLKDNTAAAVRNNAFYFYITVPIGAGKKNTSNGTAVPITE